LNTEGPKGSWIKAKTHEHLFTKLGSKFLGLK
jgi:hypothetical protein